MTVIMQERGRSLLVRREDDPRLLFRAELPRDGRVLVSASDAVDRDSLSDAMMMDLVLSRVIDGGVRHVELRDLARVPPREARRRATAAFEGLRAALHRTADRLDMEVSGARLWNEYGVWVASFEIEGRGELADAGDLADSAATRPAPQTADGRILSSAS